MRAHDEADDQGEAAINDMIDVTTARRVALRTELPTLILVLILMVAVLSAFMDSIEQFLRDLHNSIR